MELPVSSYWRDADLAGLQFTSSLHTQREIRPHRHVGFMLSVSDTELQVRTSWGTTLVPAGCLLRVAPRVWHAAQARRAPWREHALYCSFAVARCLNTGDAATPASTEGDAAVSSFAEEPWGREFVECHRLLHEAAHSASAEAAALGRALLRQRLAQWIPAQPSPAGSARNAWQVLDSGDARVNRLYGLIASDFQQRLTLEGLAQAVGWHPIHVQRRCKAAWGFTPHELVVGHRIEYARDLMAGGACVTYAAHAAGFFDQSHLHKAFLSTYAVAPGEYRRLSGLDALQPVSARNGVTD